MTGMAEDGGTDFEFLGEDYTALVLVEANLEVPPTFQLRRTDPNKRVAEFRNTLINENGEKVNQYWRISVPEPYELPGSFDQDVWVAVQALVGMRGGMPPDGVIYFSLYELLGIMRKPRKGENYVELRESLLRLGATHFHADNAFYLKDSNELATRAFNLWDVSLRTSINRRSGEAREKHSLEFHSVVRKSFGAEYLKPLDSDFYFSLRSPLAKRLYRLVDRKRGEKARWSTNLDKLKDMAPLAPSYRTPSKIRDVLKVAHRELQDRGFLAEAAFEKRGEQHFVRYRVDPEFDRRRALAGNSGEAALDNEQPEKQKEAATLLVSKGVWANVARDLVKRHGVDKCHLYVEALPYQKGIEDPGAWLRWAIETSFPLPNHLQPQPTLLEEIAPQTEQSIRAEAADRAVPFSMTRTKERPTEEDGAGEVDAAQEEHEKMRCEAKRRFESGDFDQVIETLETVTYEEYSKLVGTKVPVVDAADNRYYVSLEGDLYVYLGGLGAEHRRHVKTLDRPRGEARW